MKSKTIMGKENMRAAMKLLKGQQEPHLYKDLLLRGILHTSKNKMQCQYKTLVSLAQEFYTEQGLSKEDLLHDLGVYIKATVVKTTEAEVKK